MIKYNEVIYKSMKICVISDEVWYNNNKEVIPHRNCEWEEEIEEENDKKRPYFKNEYRPTRYIKKTTQFSDTEPILPYLINRFALENIYIREDSKLFKLILNPNLYKKILREEKLNKLFNKTN